MLKKSRRTESFIKNVKRIITILVITPGKYEKKYAGFIRN